MKLASLKEGRDGRLVLVKKDLSACVPVSHIAQTMQQTLDNWATVSPQLEELSQKLENGDVPNEKPFDMSACASPLPRAYHVADGSAYLNHVELVRKARGAEMPPEFLNDPLMYQAVSDTILSPSDDIPVPDEAFGIDFEAEVADGPAAYYQRGLDLNASTAGCVRGGGFSAIKEVYNFGV